MARILESNKDSMLVLRDDGQADLIPKTPLNVLRFQHFDGRPIDYQLQKGGRDIKVTEMKDGSFTLSYDGKVVRLLEGAANGDILATALLAEKEGGSPAQYISLWEFVHYLDSVGLTFVGVPSWYVLSIVDRVSLQFPIGNEVSSVAVVERENEIVGKVVLKRPGAASGDGESPVESRVVLIGRGDSKDAWFHYVPPEYVDRSVEECELWLAGVNLGEDALIIKGLDRKRNPITVSSPPKLPAEEGTPGEAGEAKRARRVMYMQGDVILEKVEAIPPGCSKESGALKVEGKTGNNHTMRAKVYSDYSRRYVVVKGEAALTHPQHPPLLIPGGIYAVRGIREHGSSQPYSD